MNAKTMEGLVGARTNMNVLDTPMRVYKDARRRGDQAVMERAMGYVGEFAEKAGEYKVKADEGMEEDAKEARKEAERATEKAIEKRREEREEFAERLEKQRDEKTDTVEISGEGEELAKELTVSKRTDPPARTDSPERTDPPKRTDISKTGADERKEPAIYTKTGEAAQMDAGVSISVSV